VCVWILTFDVTFDHLGACVPFWSGFWLWALNELVVPNLSADATRPGSVLQITRRQCVTYGSG